MITILSQIDEKLIRSVKNNKNKIVLIIKFTADWCGPCKLIKDTFNTYVNKLNPVHFIVADIDIENSNNIVLYNLFKKKKMIKGIPSILAFYSNKADENWYIPNDSIVGANIDGIEKFFNRCMNLY